MMLKAEDRCMKRKCTSSSVFELKSKVSVRSTMKDRRCVKLRERAMLVIVMIVMIDFFTIFVATESTAVVHTTFGPIRGEILSSVNSTKYAAFKGIRYAKAPVGQYRFQPPVPVKPWTKILDAVREGSDCIQRDPITGGVKGDEDCLFINVCTPVTDLRSTPAKLKSVMVWIYGGGFSTGSSSTGLYHPDYIIEKDIVYVSFNYRVGPLGFLGMNHPNATGNAGLKDQVLALKWVQANIAKFGGNPKNVTIFGQSAGSASVGYHVLSDSSAGLFHGTISMSGVPLNPWAFQTPAVALAQAEKLAVLLGATSMDKATLLKTFYRATTAELINATAQISGTIPSFLPTLENESIAKDVFLPECSVDKYKTGNYHKVPQLLGFMDQEAIYFLGSENTFIATVNYCINIANNINMTLPPGLDEVKNLINTTKNFYDQLSPATLSAIINETTDILYTAQIDETQKLLAANNGKPVYYYHVSFYSNKSLHNILAKNNLQGPGHTDDIPYIFYFPALNYSTDPTDPVARTIYRYSTMWTNFAKYGNPTPNWVKDNNLKLTWPNSGPSGTSLDIGVELTVGSRPISANAKLVQSLSEPLLETTNGCIAKC